MLLKSVGSVMVGVAATLALLDAGLNPQAGSKDLNAFNQDGDRKFSRVLYYTGASEADFEIKGEYWVEWSEAEWKDEYDQSVENAELKRWRFGKDQWTSFDTNIPLTIGGQKIAPGHYYLVLARPEKDKYALVFLDPTQVRAKKYDAFAANLPNVALDGISVPLTHEKADSSKKFALKLTTVEKDQKTGLLEVRFGPHRLTAATLATL